MEINYFLDNQQIIFDDVTTDIRAKVNIKTIKIDEILRAEEQNVETAITNEIEEVLQTADNEEEDSHVALEVWEVLEFWFPI